MNPSPFFDEPPRPNPFALIVDLDDTLCVGFDCPIDAGCEVLRAIDRQRVTVHYVTARPEASRDGTEQFIVDHRLPGWKNLHFCPHWKSTRAHKTETNHRIAREYRVIASIGDTPEDALAALEAGIHFVQVDVGDPCAAWKELAELIALALAE